MSLSFIESFVLRCRQVRQPKILLGVEDFENRVGGEPEIIPERKNVIYVTLQELVDDINQSPDGYCFIRVLEKEDRGSFLRRLREDEYVDIYQRKAIKLSVWLSVMSVMRLSIKHAVYRRAYWGEHFEKREISERLTDYVVPIWFFERYQASQSTNFIERFAEWFRQLTEDEPVKNILLIDNHMEIFEFSTKYRRSSWRNINYVVKNELYGQPCDSNSCEGQELMINKEDLTEDSELAARH